MKTLSAALVLLIGLAIPTTASAQSDQAPNLVGTWEIVFETLEMADGTSVDATAFEATIVLTEQEGYMVRGQLRFTSDLGNFHDGEQQVSERDVGLMGVISWSGDEITLISHGEADAWVISGQLAEPDVMELIGYETGEHAWVSRKRAVRR
ncbi:hypothetical protein [Bauldia sp.]|uniref:hypothetical protein n=1 Tax=Bauldia sp. TaxID=2575872 RepID=UPI003BABB156